MRHKTAFNSLKFIVAVFLYMGTVASVFGQVEPKPKFVLKDRFISSAGAFFAQPTNAAIKNNYLGLSYSPQLNLLNSFSDFSIAFGSQVDAGYKLSSTDNNSKLMASIPAMITFNVGHLASRDFYSTYGIFAGGGYDFCFIGGAMKQGFIWSAGLRTWFFRKSFTLRYSQLLLDESKINMRIFSIQLNLGDYLKQVYKNNKISRFQKPMHH